MCFSYFLIYTKILDHVEQCHEQCRPVQPRIKRAANYPFLTSERPRFIRHSLYPDCDKFYTDKRNLEHHVSSNHEKHKNKKYQCPQPNCTVSYGSRIGLFKHNSAVHKNIKHVCAGCNEEFKQNSALNHHIRVINCQPNVSKPGNDMMAEKIEFVEKHLADIDLQIETVAALISGFESFECTDCFLNKWFSTFISYFDLKLFLTSEVHQIK